MAGKQKIKTALMAALNREAAWFVPERIVEATIKDSGNLIYYVPDQPVLAVFDSGIFLNSDSYTLDSYALERDLAELKLKRVPAGQITYLVGTESRLATFRRDPNTVSAEGPRKLRLTGDGTSGGSQLIDTVTGENLLSRYAIAAIRVETNGSTNVGPKVTLELHPALTEVEIASALDQAVLDIEYPGLTEAYHLHRSGVEKTLAGE